jgi:hypothetical protein
VPRRRSHDKGHELATHFAPFRAVHTPRSGALSVLGIPFRNIPLAYCLHRTTRSPTRTCICTSTVLAKLEKSNEDQIVGVVLTGNDATGPARPFIPVT